MHLGIESVPFLKKKSKDQVNGTLANSNLLRFHEHTILCIEHGIYKQKGKNREWIYNVKNKPLFQVEL